MRLNMPREFYIPKGSTLVRDKLSDAIAYLWASKRTGKPGATIFMGKQAKPVSNFYYRDEGRRQAAVGLAFESRRKSLAFKSERQAKRKAFVHSYKVGDILHTSWGYDQTNVEFFQITEVKGKYVILREIGAESIDTGPFQGRCTPLKDNFLKPRFESDKRGQPIRRLAQEHGIKIDDVRTAWPVRTKTVAGIEVADTYHWSNGH